MEIKANVKGTRFIDVTEEHLETIKEYSLLNDLIDSTGIIDDTTVEKLQSSVRALLESGADSDKGLLSLCFDVIYHRDFKPVGLRNLILLYISYNDAEDIDLDGLSTEDMLLGDNNEE